MAATTESIATLTEEQPTAHPLPFSLRHLRGDGILAPPRHLRDWYQHLWEAVYKSHTPTNLALFAPRNYAKTVSTIDVAPAWLAVNFPSIRIAIVSHKKTHADKRAKTAVAAIEEACERHGVAVYDSSKTTIQLEAGTHNIEPTLEPLSIRTSDTGSHYDVIIYDDIATLTNQTTALRETISENFEEFYDNVAAKAGATCLPHKSLNIVIGTRKTPEDVYREHVLATNNPEWDGCIARGVSQPGWAARVWRATPDWHVVENEAYEVHATDGEVYDTIRDVPGGAEIVDDGIRAGPATEFRTLWPAFEAPETLLTKVVSKGDGAGLWRAENQQNPEAAIGRVLDLDWLRFVDPIPRDDWSALEWYAGLDFANPNNLAAEERGETDYWSLAVYAYDREHDQEYAIDVWRDRGYMWKEAAEDFVGVHLSEYPVGELLVESNFDGKEIADVIEEYVDVRVTPTSSEGEKEQRLHRLANRFQQGRVKVASEENQRWESFIREEWLPFPDAAHDDRFDALEIASRGPDSTVDHASSDEFEHLDW
jgi:phage terminase large subunit-like protein